MKKYSFPYTARLHTKKEFASVLKNRHSSGSAYFTVYIRATDESLSLPRIGIVTSKKVGKAVVRFKLKRRIREFFRLNRGRLRNVDIIIISKKKAAELDYSGIAKEISRLWEKAGVWKK